jgi:hypothetical protein
VPIFLAKCQGQTIRERQIPGGYFDKELRFKAHQQYAVKMGTAAALALASIRKSTCGAPYKYIRQLFQATVATRLDYAPIVWHRPKHDGASAKTEQKRQFSTVQGIAMKAILGCYRTTPTAAIEAETGLKQPWIQL